MSFTPDTDPHEPDWIRGLSGIEFCSRCGRDRDVPNLLHLPADSPFTNAARIAFEKGKK